MSQQICETDRGYEEAVTRSELDEEGNRSQRRTVFGWSGISNLPVTWSVSGGEAPYSLVIDGESGYRDDNYVGATGTATVGCADTSGGTSFLFGERLYTVNPQVDSGWKTVRAVATDANGDTAEATVQFYVILDLGGGTTGDILKRGETYRVAGALMTAPADYDIRVGGVQERECAVNDPDPRCGDNLNGYGLVGVNAGITLYEEDRALHRRWPKASNADQASGAAADPVSSAVDSLVDSLGKLPQRKGGSE